MAISKTRTAPMSAFEELPADEVAYREHHLAIIDRILASCDGYTGRECGMLHLYYKCGMSQEKIAWVFGCNQSTVSRFLAHVREKASP